jgi:hypothetical protein
LQEIVRIDEAKDYTHKKREVSSRRIIHDDGFGKLICDTAGLKLAAPSGQHISYPPAISPIGECDRKAARLSKNIHRRPVKLAGVSTRVCDDAKAGQSGSKWPRDSVCDRSVEGRDRPFEESNQKDRDEQDCEKRDNRFDNSHGRLFPMIRARDMIFRRPWSNLISH